MNIKIIIRNLLRNKLFTGLNITGLSIGLCCVLLISLWIFNELGYDRFNENFERIYQINFKSPDGGIMAGSPAPLSPAITEEIAMVEKSARVRNNPGFAFKYKETMNFEEKGITADPQLFDIFSFEVLLGDPKKALDQIHGIVITESFARRYFGSGDPMNKEFLVEGKIHIPVQAVIKDIPALSHIQFDYILPHKFAVEYMECGMEWGDPNFRTYILLNNKNNYHDAEKEITQLTDDRGMPHVKYSGYTSYIRPLKNIHLDYEVPNRLGETGDYRYIYIFGSIAVLILVLASINYINLTVSQYAKRYRSTSLKKICGAYRSAIFRSHFLESSFTVLFAFLVAVASIWFLHPYFEMMVNKKLGLHLTDPYYMLLIITLFFISVLLCALYPSTVFSGSKAIEVMNRFSMKKAGIIRGMVVFQNVIAVLLIILAIGVNKQMKYITNKKLGFNTERIAYTYLRGNIHKKISAVRDQLLENPNITDICLKDCVPFNQRNGTVGISWKIDGEWKNRDIPDPVGMETTRIDDNYFDMFGVQFAAGRNFSESFGADKQNYIVNEEAVRQMGLNEPLDTEFMLYGRIGIIVGVIRDTYFKNLHKTIEPQLFYLYNDEAAESYFSALFFRIGGDTKAALKHVGKVWKENNPGIPFEYQFLDEDYKELYESDSRISKMLGIFTLLTVFIACLGLLGQIIVSANNRIKEIGIRKVNGAKIMEVMALLNKDFVKWQLISFFIACPIAWYAMNKWLENFAYKSELSWWIFALAGLLALGIALLTVSFQSYRAAIRNPVESLRNE